MLKRKGFFCNFRKKVTGDNWVGKLYGGGGRGLVGRWEGAEIGGTEETVVDVVFILFIFLFSSCFVFMDFRFLNNLKNHYLSYIYFWSMSFV